jgi:hypothetical protein
MDTTAILSNTIAAVKDFRRRPLHRTGTATSRLGERIFQNQPFAAYR